MSTAKVVGSVKSSTGHIQIVSLEGTVRDALEGSLIYLGDKIVSDDANANVEIKYLALADSITLTDVISMTDANNDLVINSADHNASDQVSVDASLIKDANTVTQNGSVYDSYSGDNGATLLIEIHTDISQA